MTAVVQQLRTTDATKIPAGLEPGQIAFNVANKWMFVGVGGADILVENVALAGYGSTQTVLGKAGVVVPARPAAGKGYEIYNLHGVDTDGFSITDALVDADTSVGLSAKITGALTTAGGFNAATLRGGDMVEVTEATPGTPVAGVPAGTYIWNSGSWHPLGSIPPAATTTLLGMTMLARDTDVIPTGGVGATVPGAGAVATAAQLKSTNAQLATVLGGTALLGTYSGGTSTIAAAGPEAAAAGRGGMTNGAALAAATGVRSGDYFVVTAPGTIAATEPAGLASAAVNSGDTLMFNGATWSVLSTGPSLGAPTLHGLGDVADATVATVTAANVKGLLVRDSSVATDGDPAAWKLVSVVDLGTF